jgi:hypothetical protein
MFSDDAPQLRKGLFYALIGSIVFGAGLGLVFVLRDEWSWFEVRVMITAATFASARVAGLACDAARSARRANVLAWVGLGLTVLAAVMVLAGVWGSIDAEAFWKTTACVCFFALAAVQTCLLAIARLSRRFAWVFFFAAMVAFALATVWSLLIIYEGPASMGELPRLAAALSIIDAAVVLIVPVLHRLSRLEEPGEDLVSPLGERSLAAIDAELNRLRRRIRHLENLRADVTGERPGAMLSSPS